MDCLRQIKPAGKKRKEEKMENLKKHSIRIDGNIIVFWPQKNSEEDIDMSDIGSKFNGA